MRNDTSHVQAMRFHAAMLAHHARDEGSAVAHVMRHIDGLGLGAPANDLLLRHSMAETVDSLHRQPETLAAVRGLDDASQVEELKRIRAQESSGPEKDDNSADEYIRKRDDDIRSGERTVGRREKRAALRR